MEIAEVQDKESLERYLRALPEDAQRVLGIHLFSRSVARMLPLLISDMTLKGNEKFDKTLAGFAETLVSFLEDMRPRALKRYAINAVFEASKFYELSGRTPFFILQNRRNIDLSLNRVAKIVDFGLQPNGADWNQIRADIEENTAQSLWNEITPAAAIDHWYKSKQRLLDDQSNDWSFWIAWYERVLAGRDTQPDALAPIFNRLTKEDWKKGPAHINPMFDDVLAMYRADDARMPALANAAPVEFTFDALAKVMRMIGIDDTTAHLRQPEIVQAFLDDSEQVQELFEDFVEDAKTLAGGGNFAGLLQRKAEKILAEFQRTADKTHLRAEMLVIKASELEVFTKDAKTRADLGDTLADHLDTRIQLLKRLCRDHFGPSYAVLAPLAHLNFDHIDQAEVLRIIDAAIAKVDALPTNGIYPLDAEGRAVLHDMRRELDDFRAAIAEASSDAFKAVLEQRMAQSAGSLGLTLTRFAKRSAEAAGNVERGIAVTKRVNDGINDLSDIAARVVDIFKAISS